MSDIPLAAAPAQAPEFALQRRSDRDNVAPGLLEGMKVVAPPPAREPMGFFIDSTVCIGCKACEVACKQWNALPAGDMRWSGQSYDNTLHLSATTWRHVSFTEQLLPDGGVKWLFNSDVCKHCTAAPCQEACPTGALIYNEFGNVYVQQDVCNGCGYCVAACPFGVIGRSDFGDGLAHKCTLCYDRQKDGLEPACAKSCPTDSIRFGPIAELKASARTRVDELRANGEPSAYLYGADAAGTYQSLNAFFLLTETPEAYNLPPAPIRPVARMARRYAWSAAVGIGLSALGALVLAKGGR
ncbi:MAG TPA: 4Fe-4S dicluster domain-containing protein [Thermomicrobiales bacterium]|nr:4Fe-4S dicluster domain-containing protein [Thermomicrobiales bacterium]